MDFDFDEILKNIGGFLCVAAWAVIFYFLLIITP